MADCKTRSVKGPSATIRGAIDRVDGSVNGRRSAQAELERFRAAYPEHSVDTELQQLSR